MLRCFFLLGLASAGLWGGNMEENRRLPKSLRHEEEYCGDQIPPLMGGNVGHPKSRPCYGPSDWIESSVSIHGESVSAPFETTTTTTTTTTQTETVTETSKAVGMSCTKSAEPVRSTAIADPYLPTVTTSSSSLSSLSSGDGDFYTSTPTASDSESESRKAAASVTATSIDSPPVVTGAAVTVQFCGLGALGAVAGLFLAWV